MLRGAAICGCNLPQTEMFARFISKEIESFISEFGYREFTLSEIILAMLINTRHNLKASGLPELEKISFFGNCINIDYLSSILFNYSTLRKSLDRKLQNFIDGY
jgi:hypothetical protein